MKHFYASLSILVFGFLFFGFDASCQDFEEALHRRPAVIPEAYDRSSLSWALVYNSGDSYITRVKKSYNKIYHTDKFFINPLKEDVFEFRGARSTDTGKIPADVLETRLNEKKISQQIISHWYNRTEDGRMDMERIHKRGMANATDADVLREQSTTRGNWALMDYGNRLIDKSYIVTLDFSNVRSVDTDTYYGYRATVYASLFRVNLSEEDKELIYDAWVLEDDSDEEARKKRELFETIEPTLEYVTQITTNVNSYNYKEGTFLGTITSEKSTEELFQDLAQSGYDNVLFELERNYDDFNVITPLYSTRPLGAKIGKKEGLSVDQRFFVYEHRYNPETQDIKEVRRGVIRATSDITDNREEIATGDMEPSRFYQVAGRRLEEGYVLQQNNDYGIGLHFGPDLGEIGGGSAGVSYQIGRAIGVRALYATGNIGFDSKEYPNFRPINDPGYDFDGNVSFFRWDVGLEKGIHFFRNFELRPYIGYGQEQESEYELKTHFLKFGGNLALNITYNFQVVAGYNFYTPFGNAIQDEDVIDYKYTDIFENREGESPFLGLRFKF